MSQAYVVAVDGLDSLENLNDLDPKIARYAQMAINRTARDMRSFSAKEIRRQVAFPARYLSGANGRLQVSKKAGRGSLEAEITGRDRPTSLARFAKSRNVSASRRRGGVSVTVAPGQPRFMEGAFLMHLRGGNIGLALRLGKGGSLRNKREVRKVGPGLYVLYGPSVNQAFRGVAEDNADKASKTLQREFVRLLEL